MSRANPPLPETPSVLLLVEGGDERSVCMAVAGPRTWSRFTCWCADGAPDLPKKARLARLDPNFAAVQAVGVLLDIENSPDDARRIAGDALGVFGAAKSIAHAAIMPAAGSTLRAGAFFAPDGTSNGSIETLCRKAVRSARLAACVDQLVACSGNPHALQARADKGWLRAYLGMTADPSRRVHQAFDVPDGLDPLHAAFDDLRAFLQAL